MRFKSLLYAFVAWAAATTAGAAVAEAQDLKPIRVILVGDSTMTNKSGYGAGFCARFRPEVTCINLARGGRSSKSYRVEGLWDEVMARLQNGGDFDRTYVWIGFGHNDASDKPERHTDLKTEFPVNMRQYGLDIRSTGAIPIMVTPLTQRWFKDGVLKDELRPWAAAIREVAQSQNIELVDVYAVTQEAVQAMGPVAANRLAGEPIPQNVLDSEASGTSVPAVYSDASQAAPTDRQGFDYTHLGSKGSAYIGKLVVDTWAAQDESIRPYVKADIDISPMD